MKRGADPDVNGVANNNVVSLAGRMHGGRQHGRPGGRVLVLNASYEPINVCTMRRATVLVLKERAEVLEHGEGALHLSGSRDGIAVRDPADPLRPGPARRPPPQDHAQGRARSRDAYTCQYCGRESPG